jgi:hypothetical protein
VEVRGLIAPGRGERAVSDLVRDLAHDLFGVGRFWHTRIVRAGPDTLLPYRHGPPDRLIDADGIGPAAGRCHWILEIHPVGRENGFGGFYEQLLDL